MRTSISEENPEAQPGHVSTALPERRRFFARIFWLAIGTVSAGLVTPVLIYVLGPLLRSAGTEEWVRLGNVDDFQPLQPKRVEIAIRRREGWITEDYRIVTWVVRTSQKFMVYDPHCTHLGCAYSWANESRRFLCPCHEGIFDINGCVVSGPPPRPLDTYEYAVRNGALYAIAKPRRRASCRSAKA